ncbi:hypothetical protein [Bacillus sp. S0628]|uniref:hypothetical protein n=1 Tax=Bacillus sp. S0628 TaxID=2957802 RepID=UPI00209F5EA7|nr:hypothetical protein [Bacillus sp. S0628]MCP1324244.1 hypothetical protein [Bacillus sp. S0628]
MARIKTNGTTEQYQQKKDEILELWSTFMKEYRDLKDTRVKRVFEIINLAGVYDMEDGFYKFVDSVYPMSREDYNELPHHGSKKEFIMYKISHIIANEIYSSFLDDEKFLYIMENLRFIILKGIKVKAEKEIQNREKKIEELRRVIQKSGC